MFGRCVQAPCTLRTQVVVQLRTFIVCFCVDGASFCCSRASARRFTFDCIRCRSFILTFHFPFHLLLPFLMLRRAEVRFSLRFRLYFLDEAGGAGGSCVSDGTRGGGVVGIFGVTKVRKERSEQGILMTDVSDGFSANLCESPRVGLPRAATSAMSRCLQNIQDAGL